MCQPFLGGVRLKGNLNEFLCYPIVFLSKATGFTEIPIGFLNYPIGFYQ